jgi:signal transduction histidine kinase
MEQSLSPKTRQRAVQHMSRMPVQLNADVAALLVKMTEAAPRAWLSDVRLTPKAWSQILSRLPMYQVRQVAARNDLPVAISLQLVAIRPTPLMLPAPDVVSVPNMPASAEKLADDVLDFAADHKLAANDFEPLPDFMTASRGAVDSGQVQALLERIAWFRKRPVNEPDMEVDAELSAPLLEAETAAMEASASTADSLFLLENPLSYEPTPAAFDAPPAEPLAEPSLAVDLTILLADWYWETDRHGMFVYAGQNKSQSSLPVGALPTLKGQRLLDWLDSGLQSHKVEIALRRRTSFHHVQLSIADGSFAGDWQLSAVAAFDPQSGVYLGHRGVAQRLLPKQQKLLTDVPDALATAAHETRTPLNAIMGFAQMIETQPFGPVSPAYTAQASAILDASNRLLRALDDVSESSQLDRGIATMRDHGFNLETMLLDLLRQLQQSADRRQVRFILRSVAGVPSMWSDRDIVERCIGRLAIAMMSVAAAGETINVHVRDAVADHVSIAFSRPERLAAVSDTDLMKPVQSNEQDEPRLHIGFALRLVERLAAVVGGRLILSAASIDLVLPAVPSLVANAIPAPKGGAIRG